jgi:5-methylcytosine-specific restriction endonuclease McrA
VLAEGDRCRLCHESGDKRDPLEVDHLVPKRRAGATREASAAPPTDHAIAGRAGSRARYITEAEL